MDSNDKVFIAFLIAVCFVFCFGTVAMIFEEKLDRGNCEKVICIGGCQYELVVNEFNEPVWCGENAE